MIRRLLWRTRLLFFRLLGREPRLAVLISPSPEEVRRRLHARLFQVARRMCLPVLPQPPSQMILDGEVCAGQYHYGAIRHIRIHAAYVGCPWVLAHELGHAIARVGEEGRHGEFEADCRARALVCRLLLPHELAAVEAEMTRRLDGSGIVPAKVVLDKQSTTA